MKFRPCIDIHDGRVKQIVGSTLTDKPSSFYAEMYRKDRLTGGHIIKLGPGCDAAALAALNAYPGGMQIGGGITEENAPFWLEQGASEVIVTSYIFKDGRVYEDRLRSLVKLVGKDNLVLDLSCRKKGESYYIVTDRWQNFTDVVISLESLRYFSGFCCEFLIHAVDVEGECAGIEADLARDLGSWVTIPTTYAGGVKNSEDLEQVKTLGKGKLDVTIGSALDIFGGSGIAYQQAVAFNRAQGE